ncbi:MAG: cadherin-like domain-containing protein [Candidatus Thiodiazotropha sp. (ex Ustalcina ferruginea)]|nr:cadherin-like domain-containing protein [Candidatus Thiodiazotropha sp. (ex Ustalcina ferruginea)]
MTKSHVIKTILSLIVMMGALLPLTSIQAAGPPSCTINLPQNDPMVATGGSVVFQGTVSQGAPGYNVVWTFEGGAPAGANEFLSNSGDQTAQYNVTYANAGTFTATLTATDTDNKKPKSCSATRTVTVGGTNNPPVAQHDDYNTQQDTRLDIAAPGVLSNDNDPDGDPMSAELVDNVIDGTLNLSADGSFTYDPDPGFNGQDSFTYTANDVGGPSNVATVTLGVTAAGEVSINSTSVTDT